MTELVDWSRVDHVLLDMDGTLLDLAFDNHFCAPKEDPRFWQRLMVAHPFEPARVLFADDSLPVLRAARAYGIGQLIAIRHPDTTQPKREIDEFMAVDRLADLLPGP